MTQPLPLLAALAFSLPSLGHAQSAFFDNLSVQPGLVPTISNQPVSSNLPVGQTANFSVTAGGTDPLLYQWRYNGTNLAGATNSSLVLTNAQTNQSGGYSVQITNLFGSVTSAVASLLVTNPATIPLPPATLSSVLGSNTVTFSWSAVSNAVTYRLSGSNTAAASTNLPGLTGTSRVVSNLPAGTWTFRAFSSNSAGESPSFSATTFNYFTTPPAAPATFGVTFSNTNTARFSWSAAANAASYVLYGSRTTNALNPTPWSTNIIVSSTTATISNLAPGAYYWSIKATNNGGLSGALGTNLSVFGSSPATPATFSVSFTNTNTARFSWSAAANAASYVLYGSRTTNALNPTPWSTNIIVSSTTATISNLAPGAYYWSIKATNNGGLSGALGTNISVFGSSPATPATFSVSFTNTNTARFSWSAAANAASYVLYGSRTTNALNPTPWSTNIIVSSTTATISNLAPGAYYWSIKATNNGGLSGALGTNISVFGSSPATPATFSVSVTNTNTARFSWSAAANAASYVLYGSRTTNALNPTPWSTNIIVSSTTATISNLAPGAYYWSIKATNNGGLSGTLGTNIIFLGK